MYAVFPLGIVVLPGESVALHLFEPRYKQLFKDFKDGREFAIIYKDRKGMSQYGSLVYIEKVINEYPDETVDLIVKGTSIVQLSQFIEQYPEKLYSGIEATVVNTEWKASTALVKKFEQFLNTIDKKISQSAKIDLFYIANRLELDAESKKELIQQKNEANANCFLLNQINLMERLREQEELLQQKFHLN
jgi:ABC-type molybdate transport system substrate-binding protein